jgi:hypothetical protein
MMGGCSFPLLYNCAQRNRQGAAPVFVRRCHLNFGPALAPARGAGIAVRKLISMSIFTKPRQDKTASDVSDRLVTWPINP